MLNTPGVVMGDIKERQRLGKGGQYKGIGC